MNSPNNKLTLEQRLFWLSLLGGLPASLLLIWLLIAHDYSNYLVALVVLYLVAHVGICAYQVKSHILNQFRTLTNLLEALTHNDYSLRGRKQGTSGALNELISQINSLADLLVEQRYVVKETQLLLGKVINHIDVAVFTFDENRHLTLVNPAGAELYNKQVDNLLGLSVTQLGLGHVLDKNGQVIPLTFGEKSSRFHITTDQFIDHNQRHTLLFMTNVQAVLRQEERKAWQNLIRVISHELNNSLAPIASISQSLMDMQDEQNTVMRDNLALINERAKGLSKFIESYQQLAKLPPPALTRLSLTSELEQISSLFPELVCELTGQDVELSADPSQMRQLLINVFKNALEAMSGRADSKHLTPKIQIHWIADEDNIRIHIQDEGPGISNPENLFVPFYSTKPGGSGIGLLLCRQIAEGHGGEFSLTNAEGGGSIATIKLPKDM